MSKLKFRIKKFFAYRKLKKLIYPLLKEPESVIVPSKGISAMYILSFLIDLLIKKSDMILIVDDAFEVIVNSIPELKDYKIYTPHRFKYQTSVHNFILCTPLSEEGFDVMYSKSVIDDNNYYIFLT